MPSFYPGGEGPAISYRNVIEVPFPEEIKNKVTIDSLIGEVIYFKYRLPEESEIKAIRNYECHEAYELPEVPLLIITEFSLVEC